ncbi:MAG TPA: glycerate kinase [Homoserinimonas sp.]|nr:glycerate kinase [Homoserinimonas sp.]
MGLSVVIAPDSFKGSLRAADTTAALAAGWRELRPGDDLQLLPQADGGEGTLDAIGAAVPTAVRHHISRVTGPDGRPTDASWLELPDGVAVVELAESSGLPLMATPHALGATTRGLGEVIRSAFDAGATSLVVALGGSASTDGGAGALQALGLQLLQEGGAEVPPGGGGLALLRVVDRRQLMAPPSGGVTLLTDVTAPLLGSAGAAQVFGPQKGATPEDVRQLESALTRFSGLLGGDTGQPGSGAAGGTAYGFATAWGATVEPGADWIANVTGLPSAIGSADVVITGEGRFDSTSLTGKVVGNVIQLAGGSRVGVVAGVVSIEPPGGVWAVSLTELAGSADAAMAEPERWLHEAGRVAAKNFARCPSTS